MAPKQARNPRGSTSKKGVSNSRIQKPQARKLASDSAKKNKAKYASSWLKSSSRKPQPQHANQRHRAAGSLVLDAAESSDESDEDGKEDDASGIGEQDQWDTPYELFSDTLSIDSRDTPSNADYELDDFVVADDDPIEKSSSSSEEEEYLAARKRRKGSMRAKERKRPHKVVSPPQKQSEFIFDDPDDAVEQINDGIVFFSRRCNGAYPPLTLTLSTNVLKNHNVRSALKDAVRCGVANKANGRRKQGREVWAIGPPQKHGL